MDSFDIRPPVLTKADFVERYRQGEFGNASPTWDTYEDFYYNSNPCLRFHLRNRNASGETFYNLTWGQIVAKWRESPNPRDWYTSEMAPHDRGTLQGEVVQSRTRAGLELLFTFERLPMREALAAWKDVRHGLVASQLLQCYLCCGSWEWLNTLLDRYPYHVVEFSSFDRNWGTIPGYNTVFWEVRNY